MNRRQVLATLGCLSVSAVPGAASARSDEDDCELTEIATAMSGDEVIATEEVPKAWWDQVERSRDVADELYAELADEPWFERIGRSSGEDEICERNVFVVTVYTSDEEAAQSALEESRDGVPITIDEVSDDEEPEPLGGSMDGAADEDDDNESTDDERPAENETDTSHDDLNGESDSVNETTSGDNGANSSDADAVDNETDTAGDSDSIPGFGVLGTLAGLGGVGYLLANHHRDDHA
ncbi:PGF-CTERM sorting domain-containing protein [Natronolimnobius sp. AArcel1]|uniref:PGF-CTERM sorting domain-containing protein n=1 Tax=Natronolimnobius sp. AArcel1 TaxID=1679093 RepID=UPI001F14E0C4|nr:PGF-CTERM sorting domain-containing protein [Natronolimnobius sp. AArcel1]